MSEISSDNLGFHVRMTSLELKLKQSEDERIKLEEKFNQLLKSNKSEEAMQVFRLRENYCQVLERDRERCVRNDTILQTLTRIENRTTALTAKTDRLRVLRHYYEAYMAQHFPRLKQFDAKYTSVFGSTSDINEVPRSIRSLPSPAPSLYSPSPSITRRSSLVVPDYEIMEAKYSYINDFDDRNKPVKRRLFGNTVRSKSPVAYKDSSADNINRSASSVGSSYSIIPDTNLVTQKFKAGPNQNTSNDLLNMSMSEESVNTLFVPSNENKKCEFGSSVSKTHNSFVPKTLNLFPSSKSHVLDSKPLRSTFRSQSRPLSKSSSFSVSSYSRRADNITVPQRQPSLERRPSLVSRLRTPSPPRNRSPSPLSKASFQRTQNRSKSPLGVVDDIFKKYLINYDKRYLSDPVSESKYGKYLYPPKSSEYDYIKSRQSTRENDVCTRRFEEMSIKSRNLSNYSPRDNTLDVYSSSDSLNLRMSNDNTMEYGMSSPRSNYSNQWRDWSHYRERYEHPLRCTGERYQPCYSEDYLNQNYSSNQYAKTVPSVTIDSTNTNYNNRSFSNHSYDQLPSSLAKPYLGDFPNNEYKYKWNQNSYDYLNETPDPMEDISFKKKDTFKMPQTPKKVSFSNECLYDERLESEAGSSVDDYNAQENTSEYYSNGLLGTKTITQNNNNTSTLEDFSLAATATEQNNESIFSEANKTEVLSKQAQLTGLETNTISSDPDEKWKIIENTYPLKNSILDYEPITALSSPEGLRDDKVGKVVKESDLVKSMSNEDLIKKTSLNSLKEDVNFAYDNEKYLNENLIDPKNIVRNSPEEIKSQINTVTDISETPLSSQINKLSDTKSRDGETLNSHSSYDQSVNEIVADVQKEKNGSGMKDTTDIQLYSSQEKLDGKIHSDSVLLNDNKKLQQESPDQHRESEISFQQSKFEQLPPQELDVTTKSGLPDNYENKLYHEEISNANALQFDNNSNAEPYDNKQAQFDQYQQPVTKEYVQNPNLITDYEQPQTAYDSRVFSQENIAQDYPQQPEAYEQYAESELQQQPTDYPVENYGQDEITGNQQPVQEQYQTDGHLQEESPQYKEGFQGAVEGSIPQYETGLDATYPRDPQYQYDQSGSVHDLSNLPEQYDQQQPSGYDQYDQQQPQYDLKEHQYDQQQLQYDQQQPQYHQLQPQYDEQHPQYEQQQPQVYDQQQTLPYDPQSEPYDQHKSFDQQSHPYDQQQPQPYDQQAEPYSSQHQSFDRQTHPYDQQQPQPYDQQQPQPYDQQAEAYSSQHQSFDRQSHPYDQQQPQPYDQQAEAYSSQHQSFDRQSHPYDQQQPQPYDQQQPQPYDQQAEPYSSQHQSFDRQAHPYDQQQPQPYDQQAEPYSSQHQSFDRQTHPYDQQPQQYGVQEPLPYDQYDPQQKPQYDQSSPQQYGSQQHLEQYDQQKPPYDQYEQQPQNYDQYDPKQPLGYDQYDQQQPQQYNQPYDQYDQQQPDQYGNYGYERPEGVTEQVYTGDENTGYPVQAQAYNERDQPYEGVQPTYDDSGAYVSKQQPYDEPGYTAPETTSDVSSSQELPADNRQPLTNQEESAKGNFQAQPVAKEQVKSGEAVAAPDLSRVLESDSDSVQGPAPAVSQDDSSDFDFSSGKK